MNEWLTGAIDIHVHSSPDLIPRRGDDIEVASASREAGLRAIVLKSHLGSTTERAQIAARYGGGEVYGGVVLNGFVGGVNPEAVSVAIASGAKMVWFPTLHSAAQQIAHPDPPATVVPLMPDHAGLSILGPDGTLTAQARAVVHLCTDNGVALATGHVSGDECRAVVGYCRAQSLSTRVVLTHPLSEMVGMSPKQIRELTEEFPAFIEITAVETSQVVSHPKTVADLAAAINEIGFDRTIISSDGGQAANPPPAELLGGVLAGLAREGLDEAGLRRTVTANPGELLGI